MYKDIEGYEGLYAVSESGDIWSYKKTSPIGINGGVVERGGLFLKPSQSGRNKHQRVVLIKDRKRKQHFVHRLVAKAFIPNPSGLPFINHKDCDPTNNHVDNLEWCTAKENSIHAYQNGRWTPPDQSGSKNSNAKFCNEDIVKIRELHKKTGNCSQIAHQYNVNPKTINQIVNGKRWTHT